MTPEDCFSWYCNFILRFFWPTLFNLCQDHIRMLKEYHVLSKLTFERGQKDMGSKSQRLQLRKIRVFIVSLVAIYS